ncbi:NAD-dependent glycerol-3-phosphate dehydrogenase C-terminus [Ceratobasidium sp. AG-Ba]|nr:NAD-dependent glycerol-3-phosphate dehydrogenase C-terminus [Ceratobasidium sp. AG-Ba]
MTTGTRKVEKRKYALLVRGIGMHRFFNPVIQLSSEHYQGFRYRSYCWIHTPTSSALNTKKHPDVFAEQVTMYVYEEDINGRPLSALINETHENVKYLPGIQLGSNVVAEPNLLKAIEGATALVVVLPHQIQGHVSPLARAVSLIKGVDVDGDKITTFPTVISSTLDIPCSALSGANIANEVAEDKFCESTLGVPPHPMTTPPDEDAQLHALPDSQLWHRLFQTDTFRIRVVQDVEGVCLCGGLKNVIALAAGFSDGLGWGSNSKAAIMRIGLVELKDFCLEFFPSTRAQTFLEESCGVADIMTSYMGKEKVCIVGSGNWGSAIARIAAINTKKHSNVFDEEVTMYVHEEGMVVDGKPLSALINEKHENVKYLPGVQLGSNIHAEPDLAKALEGATALVVVVPHQFFDGLKTEGNKIKTFPAVLSEALNIRCSALGGANIAKEVGQDMFCESTLGVPPNSSSGDGLSDSELWFKLFETPTFRIRTVEDVEGVVLCDIVALASGFSDGLGWGSNTKDTFLQESCGVADVVTSSISGRNRMIAEEMAKTGKSFQALEKEKLNGQQLEGPQTAEQLHNFIHAHGKETQTRKVPFARECMENLFPGDVLGQAARRAVNIVIEFIC